MTGSSIEIKDEVRISTKKAAEISGLSQRHIRHLLSEKKLEGEKLGRDWFTTETAVRQYLARNIKPGPKAKS